jgi:DNA-binding IclR family transcriptional regulator
MNVMSSAVDRALELLRVICEAPSPPRFSDIVATTGLPKSTANRLLGTLRKHGLIRTDDSGWSYVAGYGLLSLAKSTWDGLDIRSAASAELHQLLATVQETIHLAVVDGHEIIYVDKLESPETIRLFSAIGRRGPLYCTGIGKAILAFMDSARQEAIIGQLDFVRHAPRTITDAGTLRRALAEIRARGCAFDLGEHEEGIFCVAAPIFNFRAEPVAAISVTSTASRMGERRICEQLQPLVIDAARRASRALGFLDPAARAGSPG